MPDIAGLKLIVPTSVAGSGVSVSASGKVTWTSGADTVSVNSVFSSTYDNYLVVMRAVTTPITGSVFCRMRVSGTDATGSNYTYQVLTANNTTVSGSRATITGALVGLHAASNMSGDHVYFYGPALAQPTAMRNVNVAAISGAYIEDCANTHSLSTAYDGFTFYLSGTTWSSGSLCVYGLSQ